MATELQREVSQYYAGHALAVTANKFRVTFLEVRLALQATGAAERTAEEEKALRESRRGLNHKPRPWVHPVKKGGADKLLARTPAAGRRGAANLKPYVPEEIKPISLELGGAESENARNAAKQAEFQRGVAGLMAPLPDLPLPEGLSAQAFAQLCRVAYDSGPEDCKAAVEDGSICVYSKGWPPGTRARIAELAAAHALAASALRPFERNEYWRQIIIALPSPTSVANRARRAVECG